MQKATSAQDLKLPLLRRDITIERGGEDHDGKAIALLVDPLRNAYFRLGWPASGVIACWRDSRSVADLIGHAKQRFGVEVTPEILESLTSFLFSSQLTVTDEHGSWGRYAMVAGAGRHSVAMSLVHNYLFFRIPLFRPDKFLENLYPRVSFIYTRGFLYGFLAVVLCGLYLTSRDWASLEAMFWRAASFQNLALYGVVVLMMKGVHELGHAMTTVHFGCRVPTMGVAFMLGAPVFYTDTTDSWRLVKRTQRLGIVVAGVGAEFIVAGMAVFLWPFLPDGHAREICFAIMTTTLATTLLVNLNPCMRFDGYFALSDILDTPNLQPRAFALARWKMREALFGLGEERPEKLPMRLETIMIVYAWCVWVYRLFLFCGIAAIVYAMAVKALGIILGLFEIVMFVARPIVMEMKEWWDMRAKIVGGRRGWISLGGAGLVFALIFIPWIRVVDAPAVLVASSEETIHAHAPAQVKAASAVDGQFVRKGDILFVTDSSDLRAQIRKSTFELQSTEIQFARLAASEKEQPLRIVIENQRSRGRERLAALNRLAADLVIRAPFDGKIVDVDRDIREGVWVGVKSELARVVATENVRARGLVSETDLVRIREGAAATFIPDDADCAPVDLQLAQIAPTNATRLSELALADLYGGPVAVAEERGEVAPRAAYYEITLRGDSAPPAHIRRGVVRIAASATSPFMSIWRQVARVLVREEGF
jgi:putative peptide zinc metalloprotease protein